MADDVVSPGRRPPRNRHRTRTPEDPSACDAGPCKVPVRAAALGLGVAFLNSSASFSLAAGTNSLTPNGVVAKFKVYAGIAQLVECKLPKLDVAGSTPVARSRVWLSPPGSESRVFYYGL